MTDRTQYTGEAQSEEKVYLPVEKLLFRLRMLYRQYGYQPYRMSKFEKYELYAGNKDFLVSDRVITFNDTNGDLLRNFGKTMWKSSIIRKMYIGLPAVPTSFVRLCSAGWSASVIWMPILYMKCSGLQKRAFVKCRKNVS